MGYEEKNIENVSKKIDSHISGTGEDHTYINQDVTTSASPTFAGATFTNNINLQTNSENAFVIETGGAMSYYRFKFDTLNSQFYVYEPLGTKYGILKHDGTDLLLFANNGNIKITAQGGTVDFDDENIKTTGIAEIGTLKTGSYQQITSETLAGYIEIQDKDGNVRKVAIVA